MPRTPRKFAAELAEQMRAAEGGARFTPIRRWPGTHGTPVTITYSFPPDGLNVPSMLAGEAPAPNEIHAMLAAKFGSVAAGKALIRAAFDDWEKHTGNVYVEVSDDGASLPFAQGPLGPTNPSSARGDIRIAAKPIDGPGLVGAYNRLPNVGDMVIDRDDPWEWTQNGFRLFRNMISHENGHGMGLEHVCPFDNTKLMEPFLSLQYEGAEHDDIRGMQWYYGDNCEPNGSAPEAWHFGTFTENEAAEVDGPLGLRDIDDLDYFSFSISEPGSVSVSAGPSGLTYLVMGQDAACSTGEVFNSLELVGLRVRLLDQDGATVLAEADAGGLGAAESLTDVALEEAGTYYVVVDGTETGGEARSQLYDLSVLVHVEPPAPDCPGDLNGDLVVDTADLGLLIAAFGATGMGLAADLNGDGVVDTADLGLLIGAFGAACAA